MKTFNLIYLLFFSTFLLQAQVGINTTSPNATLDIVSSNQAAPTNTDGMLIPKVDEFPLINPTAAQDGMMIYVTGSGVPSQGFYYWNQGSTSWVPFATGPVNSEWLDNGSYLSPMDGNSEDVTIGGTDNANARVTVKSNKQISGYFENSGTQDSSMIGLETLLNNNSSNTSSFTIGAANYVFNTGAGISQGTFNRLYGSGDGNHFGSDNRLSGTGMGNHTGTYNELSGTGSGYQIGTSNNITVDEDGNHTGVRNSLTGDGEGNRYGIDNYMLANSNGYHYGMSTYIASTETSGASHYGTFLNMNGSGDGNRYGSYSLLQGTGNGNRYGSEVRISNAGNGTHYGNYHLLSGAGTGNKYGSYNFIPPVAGGTHYGIYSEVTKTGSYAGYFLGNVAIGTGIANTYNLPASRGTNGQLMQTDGSGNVSWVAEDSLPYWRLGGNTGTGANNFLGTLDIQTLHLGINGGSLLEISGYGYRFLNINGNVSIGSIGFAGYGGINNIMMGNGAGGAAMTGGGNVAIGSTAVGGLTSGSSNTGVGTDALRFTTTGNYNVAMGALSLYQNTTGNDNVAIGTNSLYNNSTDSRNIAIGSETMYSKVDGVDNIAIGHQAAYQLGSTMFSSPNRNIAIGYQAYLPNSLFSNQLNIGNLIYGNNLDGAGYTISSGNIGIGITNPQDKLHIGGSIRIADGSEASGRLLQCDATGSSTWVSPSSLSFGNLADGDTDTLIQVEETADEDIIRFDTNGFERMQIDNAGNIGINTTNPQANLHVQGVIRLEATNDSDYWNTIVDVVDDYNFYFNGALRSYIQDTDGSYNIVSDRRFKNDISEINKETIANILQLHPVNYYYNFDPTQKKQHGFIAQEVQQLFPELVTEKEVNGETYLTLNYDAFGVLAIKAIQEQQQEILELKEKLSKLEALEARIAKLEQN